MLELYGIAHINPQVLRLSMILSIPVIKGMSFPMFTIQSFWATKQWFLVIGY